jgi:hypothetical protein
MLHLTKTLTLNIVLLLCISLFSSCQKGLEMAEPPTTGQLTIDYSTPPFRLGQSFEIYDNSLHQDSAWREHLPSDRYYQWTVAPNNNCHTISGDAKRGMPVFQFSCPGEYAIAALIYDSLTHKVIGKTDTMKVTILNQPLLPSLTLDAEDTLNLVSGLVQSWNHPNQPPARPDNIIFNFSVFTKKAYRRFPETAFEVTKSFKNKILSLTFSNKLLLTSFPFTSGTEQTRQVEDFIHLPEVKVGDTIQLYVMWLGKEYTGSITLFDYYHYQLNWNNNGAVLVH